jgi:hypothetical protein
MTEPKRLSLGGNDEARPIVDVFGKEYRLMAVTRSVERGLTKVERDMREMMKDADADGDAVVGVLCEGLNSLLKPEGTHRTPAGKLALEQWHKDALSLDDLRAFYDGLQEQAVTDRPT